MSFRLSERAARIVQAEIRAMSVECARVGGINLAQGICDTEVPPQVRAGAKRAVDEGTNSYTRHDGLSKLRVALSRKLRQYNRIEADPETDITVSAGSTGAFYCALLALLNPGDELVLFEPFYGYHLNTILAVEAVPRTVRMRAPDWTFSQEMLEAALTPRTRGLVVCTPSNPCGKVWTRSELECVAAVAEKHDLYVFTDEIYEYILFDGNRHVSPASLPELKDRTITISGYSKTFSVTGWRIGYSVAPAPVARMIGYLNDLIYVCAPAPLQVGVAEGIESLPPDFYQAQSATYERKRDRICAALSTAGLEPCVPGGAYYVLADASRLPGQSGKDRAMYLLREAGLATVPGEAFFQGDGGSSLLRLCFAKSDEDLDEACRRLERLG
ncbi:MAG: pyridoxal phosphate-dependent aminotransferase [Candidatus Riflebacteria bacterium]|nr:pyridoxal phosphate-dependent aminotransferase [Candidatus Riflebacteria bacterium]